MIRVSKGKIPIDSSMVANRKLPLQEKVPPMPNIQRQLITTNCKNCGAIIGKNGVCKYCGSIYDGHDNKRSETQNKYGKENNVYDLVKIVQLKY